MEVFRSFLPPALASQIDWKALSAQPGSFIDPELNSRHTDLLFSTRLCGSPAYVYLLLEHQSSNDPDMPLRMLRYLVRIWERHRRRCYCAASAPSSSISSSGVASPALLRLDCVYA